MVAFIIQDRYDDRMHYIASRGTFEDALGEIWAMEEIDRNDGVLEPDRYLISKREYCYHQFSEKCGHCNNNICMLQRPETDCPLVINKKEKEDI